MIEYTTTVAGRAAKGVTCEQCGQQYAYTVRRKATGSADGFLFFGDPEGMGAPEAERAARAELEKELAAAVEVVPCPRCGWVQRPMVEEARRRHLAWIRVLALVLFALAFISAAVGFVATMAAAVETAREPDENTVLARRVGWWAAGGLFAASVGLGFLKLKLNSRFDPNDEDPAVRIKTGKGLAMTREQVEALAAARPADGPPPTPGA